MNDKIKVLMVDDEAQFRATTQKILNKKGFETRLAASGEEALEKLDEKPDVVILDIKMPGMDGIQVLRKIKVDHPLVEVILLTGHGTTETAIQGMKLGAFDYLLKPADFEDLKKKLTGAKKKKEEQDERIRKAEARELLRRGGNI